MIAINVSKSITMLFTRRPVQKPQPVHPFGDLSYGSMQPAIGRVTLDTRLTMSSHNDQVRKKAAQRLGVLGPLLRRRNVFSIKSGGLFYKQVIRPMMDYGCPIWRSAARFHVRKLQVLSPSVFALLPVHLGISITDKSRRFWSSVFRRPQQSPGQEFLLKVC